MLKLPIAIFVMDCIPLTSYDYEGKLETRIVIDNKRGHQAM